MGERSKFDKNKSLRKIVLHPFELNHGPAYANITVVLRLVLEIQGWNYDWEILDYNHGFPLTDKVFNKWPISEADPMYPPD